FIVFLIGWYFTYLYENQSQKHDASEVVIDEMAGVFITLAFVPVDIWYYVIGFLMFRIFDVLKPYPVYMIDRQKTPFSVMFDDVVAGFMAGLVMWVLVWIMI
ncbi:MAG: phosphatidylglycerophosphatase A, partial [Alphaproteobacteria bacterium]